MFNKKFYDLWYLAIIAKIFLPLLVVTGQEDQNKETLVSKGFIPTGELFLLSLIWHLQIAFTTRIKTSDGEWLPKTRQFE